MTTSPTSALPKSHSRRQILRSESEPDSAENLTTAITGFGLATPLGLDAASTWNSLMAGGSTLDHATVPLDATDQPRLTQLALRVAREAIAAAHWSNQEISASDTALVIGTSKGPITTWLQEPPAGRSTHTDAAFGLAETASDLALHLKLGFCPRLTLSGACASGLHALIRAHMLLQSGRARRAIVVGVESSIHPLFIASFQRLGILARPGDGCRPFDEHRNGFYMSEAAAAVCLEARAVHSAEAGEADAVPPPIYIERFRLAADATHLTAIDPSGGPMRTCIRAALSGGPVDLIHAHGTATELNDAVELAAIESSLDQPDIRPFMYSHKAALGHSLGASGLIAVVLNCLAHQTRIVPANIHTRQPLPTRGVTISAEPVERIIRRSTVTAAGFGGALAALSLVSPVPPKPEKLLVSPGK